ncbi:sarcosine oxidase subunit gamma [Mameliella sp. DP3N28-2]|nr:sarcosine oxidase subunit gamma [Mameliella sediminis]
MEDGCVVELTALTPCEGVLPVRKGNVTLSEVNPGRITALMPYKGRQAELSEALQAAHGVGFPSAGRLTGGGGATCLWTARGQAMLLGPEPDPSLQDFAAVTEQSDAWAVVLLAGEDAEAVLARLVPLDLSESAFPEGHAARTLCQHMTVSVCRVPEGFQIMCFRSMARTLAHELSEAMASVAARQVAG